MQKINIKWGIIYRTIMILALVLLLMFILWKFPIFKEIIGVVIISFIISYSIRPMHKWLVERGISRKLSALIIILSILLLIAAIFAVLVPWIYNESANFSETIGNIKKYYKKITGDIKHSIDIPFVEEILNIIYEKLKAIITGIIASFVSELISIAENTIVLSIIPILVYFFLSDGDLISKGIMKYIPFNNKYVIRRALKHIDKVMEKYIITQFELCGVIGVLTFIALKISGIKYAFILSLVNAVFNIIPYFGPVIGAIPIVLIALLTSTKKAVIIIVWLSLIQQLEGDIICPKILGDTVDSHPVTILLLLIIGGSIGGIMGMIVVIPVWVMIKIMVGELEYYLF